MKKINDVYIHEDSHISGDVTLGKNTNIWPFVSIRGDVAAITVGEGTSVQDQVTLHCRFDVPLSIGNNVVIGHQACVHCAEVGDGTLIGIGSKILDNAVIGKNCLIAAGAVIRPGTVVPDGTMMAGVPAKVIRDVTTEEIADIQDIARRYLQLSEDHMNGKYPDYS
ncbi:MAG: gamma carbonic anhydrase family protein [Lentisphaeria bacterium]|nr:gamma carbonic anhydrase family protein [Lentisphaeria bacterium]NQZ70880.1 gamma carbonic anhydrase family protein [Lentisphaeria bacterium]